MFTPGKWNLYYISYLDTRSHKMYLKTAQFWHSIAHCLCTISLVTIFFKNTKLASHPPMEYVQTKWLRMRCFRIIKLPVHKQKKRLISEVNKIWLDNKFIRGCQKVSTFTFYTLLLIVYCYDILKERCLLWIMKDWNTEWDWCSYHPYQKWGQRDGTAAKST